MRRSRDVAEADRAIARLNDLTQRLRQPFWEWLSLGVAACRAQMDGHLEEVERLVFKALEVGQRASTPNAVLFFGTQLFHLREEQRRADELLPVMEQIVRERPGLPVFRIGIPLIHALAGREGDARKTFEEVAAKDFRDVPEDFHRLPMLCSSAAVAAFLGDAPRAEILRDALRQYAGRIAMAGVVTYWGGSVDHSLGRLEETLGQTNAAARCYAQAADLAHRAGARLLEAHALVDRARVLRRLGDVDSLAEAEDLLDRADAIYRERGIHEPAAIVPTVAVHSSEAATDRPPPDVVRSTDVPTARFVQREHSWHLVYRQREIVLPDGKGLAYLQRLVASPGKEIHVLDLVAATALAEAEGLVESGYEKGAPGSRLVESSLEAIDPKALGAYRDRLVELGQEREAARADRDLSRLEAIDTESSLIEAELSRATGLGDRIRQTNGATERARKAVYNRLRASIRRIRQDHEDLGHHLERSVTTGSVCAYRPETTVQWEFD